MEKIENIKCAVEFITPELAKEYLLNNNSNRSLSAKRVALYASDMASGNWQLNGEPIVFFDDGELKDGQHRLSAIMQCGIGQWMTVVRGISRKAMVHDVGQARTSKHILTLYGYPADINNTAVTGAIKIMRYINDGSAKAHYMSNMEVMDFIDRNEKELRLAYNLIRRGKNHPPMLKAPCLAAVFCALHNDMPESKVEEFCKIANTGFCDDEAKFAAVIARNAITAPTVNKESYRILLFRTILMALSDFDNEIPRKRAYTVFKQTDWELKTIEDVFNGNKNAASCN